MLYAVSRIPTNNTPLSVYSTHTLYQTKHPSHLEHNLEAGSPLAGTSTKTNSRTASGCRSHAYSPLSDISRSSSTLEGVLSSAFVFASLVSSLSLSSCVSSLACQARERARALPSLSSSFCLAVSHPITGARLKISLYREASIKRSDPLDDTRSSLDDRIAKCS